MAYPEKRGKYWRVRFRLPDGTLGGASVGDDGQRFTTKKAAKDYGKAVEADIRRGTWVDPTKGDTILKDWANKWFNGQDLEESTILGYEWHIETHILPHLGETPLKMLDPMGINAWEISLYRPQADGNRICGETSARSARTLLHTMLSDAVRVGHLRANPATRQRNRGRKKGRGKRRPERAWATPLQALLVGERLSILSGRPDDLIMALALAYLGIRWGELLGLERHHLTPAGIVIDQQIHEVNGAFRKKAPKDESYRTIKPPAFLAELLADLVKTKERGDGACRCAGPKGCGGGKYVFLSDDGTHERRSNYARRRFRPAADGQHPATSKKLPQRPVLADVASTPWPGQVMRSWPAAIPGEPFEPPRQRGFWRYDINTHHVMSWLPVKRALTPHGLRHALKVWLDEDGIPVVAVEERLGHELPGIVGTYSHTSDVMERRIVNSLQDRWVESLRERARMYGGRSPVPLLDRLLEPYREQAEQDRLPNSSQTAVLDLPVGA